MRRAFFLPALAVIALAMGCDSTQLVPYPIYRIVGADLRAAARPEGRTIEAEAVTEIVEYVDQPVCEAFDPDCLPGVVENSIVIARTRLTADRPVTVNGSSVPAGADLLAALGESARAELGLSPFAVSSLPPNSFLFESGRTVLTGSWRTNDGRAFTATATVAL